MLSVNWGVHLTPVWDSDVSHMAWCALVCRMLYYTFTDKTVENGPVIKLWRFIMRKLWNLPLTPQPIYSVAEFVSLKFHNIWLYHIYYIVKIHSSHFESHTRTASVCADYTNYVTSDMHMLTYTPSPNIGLYILRYQNTSRVSINSLRPNGSVWRHWSGSTSAQ